MDCHIYLHRSTVYDVLVLSGLSCYILSPSRLFGFKRLKASVIQYDTLIKRAIGVINGSTQLQLDRVRIDDFLTCFVNGLI